MSISYYLIFLIVILCTWILKFLFGRSFALDYPDSRKHHSYAIPQIGGLIFGPLILFFGWYYSLLPIWYLVGGAITIILGSIDDINHISWYIKLVVQIIIATYLAHVFWDKFDNILFYSFHIPVSQFILLMIFYIWFVGIYNAVNLIDGLDGLAGGFMLIISLTLAGTKLGIFSELHIIISLVILGFLVFNQRPAKLFMGDAGSLFFGFHIAVLPLLYAENVSFSSTLYMTPFVLIASHLIADTTRVFFTRIADNKSPMTADTIHFHHLILQQSGSYLGSIGSVYIVAFISSIFAFISFYNELSINIMLAHLAILLIFILTPPVETYVPIFVKIIGPLYSWQKNYNNNSPYYFRTLFILTLFIGLIFSLFKQYDFSLIISQYFLLIPVLIFLLMKKNKMFMYISQLIITLLFAELFWEIELSVFVKIFTTLLIVSYIIFTLERRKGCYINQFSSLDLLLLIICFGTIVISFLSFPFSRWFVLTVLSIWFSSRFILLRTIYL